ncbi:MAG: LPS export ABC transporter periplasmic protein LptC [Bryobacteraceae bacterium]
MVPVILTVLQMRRTRRFILLLIVLIVATVGTTYLVQKSTQARNAPSKPRALPSTVAVQADNWTWEETRNGKPIVKVSARQVRQLADGTSMQLEDVTLQIFHKDGKAYDEVKSAKADFNVGEGALL